MLQHKYAIGNFDKRVTIIKKSTANNAFNEEIVTWILHKLTWAKEENTGLGAVGNELIQADKLTAIRKTTLICRYDATLNEEMRVVMEAKVYDIISIKSQDRKRFLSLECAYLEGEVWT